MSVYAAVVTTAIRIVTTPRACWRDTLRRSQKMTAMPADAISAPAIWLAEMGSVRVATATIAVTNGSEHKSVARSIEEASGAEPPEVPLFLAFQADYTGQPRNNNNKRRDGKPNRSSLVGRVATGSDAHAYGKPSSAPGHCANQIGGSN